MVGGEGARVGNALLGVVAAAPFGDVVKEGGQIEDVLRLEAVHQRGGKRQLVAVGVHRQPPHIAQHHQNMVVDGIDVEQIVLQQADNFAPSGQIAAEYAVEIEETGDVGQPAALFEKADKTLAVDRVFIKFVVEPLRGSPPCAQGLRGDGGDVVAALQNLDDFEHVARFFDKQGFVFGGDLVADLVIIVVDGVDDTRQARIDAAAQHRQ